MKRKMFAGITSVTLPIFAQDSSSTTGAGLGGLVFNTANLVCEYRRQGANAWTAVTMSAGTLGTWSSGGFIADGTLTGAYELGVPNAAVASGARWVVIRLYGATNMLPVLIEIELDQVNYQDPVRAGLTAIPSTGASSQSSVDTIAGYLDSEIGIILAAVDTEVAAIKIVTDQLASAIEADGPVFRFTTNALEQAPVSSTDTPGTTTLLSRLTALRAGYLDNLSGGAVALQATSAIIAGYLDTEIGIILTAVDTEVAAIKAATDKLNSTFEVDGANYRFTAASLVNAPTGGGGGGGDTPGTTTLLGRLTATRAGYLDSIPTIAGYLDTEIGLIVTAIDTEVASIKTVTDQLATALELDGSVYRFTANSLEQAPAGGGGGGTGNPTIETGFTLVDCMKLMTSFLLGRTVGGGTNVVEFYDLTGSKVRVRFTLDPENDRVTVYKDIT